MIVALAALAVTVGAAPASAHPVPEPTTLQLPDGFQPEGIAIGTAPYAYFGSRLDGDIYRVSLRTGQGRIISQGPGTASLGLKLDGRGRLFVSGGMAGDARVVDTTTGRVLASYQLQTVPAFINDVIVTGGAAWYTDSTNAVLFKVPFGRHGALPAAAVRVPLTGDIAYAAGINVNGISAAPDGHGLIVVQTNTGKLFRTSFSGRTTEIDLGGASVPNGDGIWLRGRTLYVVQNRDNLVTAIRLDRSGTHGTVLSRTTDPRFDVPTTIAEFGGRFYLPNARFSTTPTPTTPYTANAVPIPQR
jgi:sugar lactone lactonase YvrE